MKNLIENRPIRVGVLGAGRGSGVCLAARGTHLVADGGTHLVSRLAGAAVAARDLRGGCDAHNVRARLDKPGKRLLEGFRLCPVGLGEALVVQGLGKVTVLAHECLFMQLAVDAVGHGHHGDAQACSLDAGKRGAGVYD